MSGAPAFDDDAFAALGQVDDVFGGAWTFAPFTRADERAAGDVADVSRVACSFVAVFVDVQAKPVMPDSYDVRQFRRPGLSSGQPRIEISASAQADVLTATGQPFIIRAPDQVTRLDDGAVFRVHSSFTTPNQTIVANLNLIT